MFSLALAAGGWWTGYWTEYPDDARDGLIRGHGRFYFVPGLANRDIGRDRAEAFMWAFKEGVRQRDRTDPNASTIDFAPRSPV